ncbi:MAG: Gfo/Idh/MocA family oxidoreductase [Acidimicrobiia bacterium]|nr:Gfo/Idh/MocA family oxidoreductase [Acidimicrobiia bacterium]MDH3471409.1 Gfo/Idh/MocA family oxidoreductase [Acidimicrobiia bacterium]
MSDKLRWGVISTAEIGTRAVIPATQRSERGEVVAIASRDKARAEEIAEQLGIATAHGSYEALLEDPNVDAVYIPLPNHLHAEWTMAAAAAGKHVLCEKPLAMSAAQAQEVVDACAEAGVKMAEAFMYRQHPQWVKTMEIVASGRLGQLTAVNTWFSYNNTDAENIRNIPEFGGGAVMDIGCYCINLSRMLFGAEPDEVQSLVYRHPQFGTDVLTSAMLRFGDAQATFTCSTVVEDYQRVHVFGSEGRLEIEIPFNAPNDRPTRLFVAQGGDPPVAPDVEVFEFPVVDHYSLQADAFAAAVLDGADVPLSNADSVANMAIIDAVFAAEKGAG